MWKIDKSIKLQMYLSSSSLMASEPYLITALGFNNLMDAFAQI